MNVCSDPYCTLCADVEQMSRTLHKKPQVSRSIAESPTTSQPVLPPQRCYNCSAQLLDDPQGLILAQKCPKCSQTHLRTGLRPSAFHL